LRYKLQAVSCKLQGIGAKGGKERQVSSGKLQGIGVKGGKSGKLQEIEANAGQYHLKYYF
jgi:hypothetical protein